MLRNTSLSFREARFEKLEIEKLHFEAGSFILELLALTLKTQCLELLESLCLGLTYTYIRHVIRT